MLGELLCSSIYLREGFTMNAEDLQEFLSTKLASFKIPVVIKFSDNSLPRLASGKFDKPLLRQMFEKTS